MNKQKLLIITVLILIFIAQKVTASALMGPSCFVTAEIIKIDDETKQLNSEIVSINNVINHSCPIKEKQIFEVSNNYPATFQQGDRIKAGIEKASSMTQHGVIYYLHWSDIAYENGDKIFSKNNNIMVDYLTGDVEAISTGQIKNYFYFVIPIVVFIGTLAYSLRKKIHKS